MDQQDLENLKSEIEAVKHELDESHDQDPDFLPIAIRELRTYVFQIHASFEQSLQNLIALSYLNAEKPYDTKLFILEQITFEGKMKLIKPLYPDFPIKTAKKINILRNEFAHKQGQSIREAYGDNERLKVFRFLKKSNDKLNAFWEVYSA